MPQKLRTTVLAVLLLGACFSYSQGHRPDNYYIMMLKGDVVSNVLNTYPQFAYFDFTFKETNNSNYVLVGRARDENGKQLGDSIALEAMTDHPARPLQNIEKGHLYLTKATMQEHDVDGTENYILTPKKCHYSGHAVNYVSYRFNNKIDDADDDASTGSLTAVKAFNLNPSPPY